MAEQCAGSLRELGIEAGDRVMLMSENRPEWGICYFGVLKAGGVCVPVDRELSLPEVENLLKASGAKFFLCSDKVAERLSDSEENAREKLAARLESKDIGALVLLLEQVLTEPSVSPAALPQKRLGGEVASVIYTSGTTGAPKGVMLSHKNFTSMASKLSSIFHLYKHDVLLSVLPLHHTFEFAAGLLMPLLHGSQVTYLEEVGPETLGKALTRAKVTGMVGVPALWQLLHRRVSKPFSERGPLVERVFDVLVDANRRMREFAPFHLGRVLFFPVHVAMGGRLRVMISGGSALSPDTMKAFRGLGFNIFEGYGMTEASPVITAQRPKDKVEVGSVGRALPGIDVKIHEPDERGVGEIIARGPNIMLGYENDPSATESAIQGGWLHTGDLGRLDDAGNLYVVGRKKEMILGSSGENVYPDEIEELYRDHPRIKEISVVGLPVQNGEIVAALIGLDKKESEEEVREHVRQVSLKLPHPKRIRHLQFTTDELPRTATRKVKRNEVQKLLERQGRSSYSSYPSHMGDSHTTVTTVTTSVPWVRDVIAQVSQRTASEVEPGTRLDALGFDSLMLAELGTALEHRGVKISDAADIVQLETVRDVERYAARHKGDKQPNGQNQKTSPSLISFADDIEIPAPLVSLGRRVLRAGQRALYQNAL
jgi:long-chain acyl-CoA synthetase